MKKFLTLLKTNYFFQFTVSVPDLVSLVRLFYGALAIINTSKQLEYVILYLNYKDSSDLENYIWIWPVKWIELFSEKLPIIWIIQTGTLLCFLICVSFPKKKVCRLLSFLFYFEHLALSFSIHGNYWHQEHPSLVASFLLIFFSFSSKTKDSEINLQKRNKFYLWAIQFSFLGSYFLSGLWKARELIKFIINRSGEKMACLSRNLASEYINGNLMEMSHFHREVLEFFKHQEKLEIFLWLGVTFFQMSTLVAAYFPPLIRLYGLMILLFHFSTSLFMNIQFVTAQWVCLIFLLGPTYYIKKA